MAGAAATPSGGAVKKKNLPRRTRWRGRQAGRAGGVATGSGAGPGLGVGAPVAGSPTGVGADGRPRRRSRGWVDCGPDRHELGANQARISLASTGHWAGSSSRGWAQIQAPPPTAAAGSRAGTGAGRRWRSGPAPMSGHVASARMPASPIQMRPQRRARGQDQPERRREPLEHRGECPQTAAQARSRELGRQTPSAHSSVRLPVLSAAAMGAARMHRMIAVASGCR